MKGVCVIMVDFNKYSREARNDPEFRKELLRGDANQAIKARFGDDLPYKVECEEEITFKVETSDSDFESVAGGGPEGGNGAYVKFVGNTANKWKRDGIPGTGANGAYGDFVKKMAKKWKRDGVPANGALSNADLGNVSGGGGPLEQGYSSGPNGIYGSVTRLVPLEEWERDKQNQGFNLETVIFPNNSDTAWYDYSWQNRSGVRCVEGVPLVRLGGQWYAKVDD